MTTSGSYRVVLIVDQTNLNDMLSGRTGDLRRVMAGFASRGTINARNLAEARLGTRSGAYKRSIRSRFTDPQHLRIEANVDYAAALELGTRRHDIPGNPLLAWPPERSKYNRWVVTPSVSHPGNRPYRILTDAVIETSRQLGF